MRRALEVVCPSYLVTVALSGGRENFGDRQEEEICHQGRKIADPPCQKFSVTSQIAIMGKGRAKSFKPAGKDKSKLASAAASKKARQRKTTSGIIHGRVETPKTERKVPRSLNLTNT